MSLLEAVDRALPSAFTAPGSVAVIGATEDRAKWGYWLADGALRGAERRSVWLVNHRAQTVLGQLCYPTVGQLPQVPELVAVCVPAAHVVPVVRDALDRGTRAFLIITAGLSRVMEEELTRLMHHHDARVLGPNSLGMADTATDVHLAWGVFTPGSLAIVSQSGQLGSELATLGARRGVGVSRFYSIGNQIDIGAAELLESMVEDPNTEVVALYLESFATGTRIRRAMQTLRDAGKYVLVLTTGASEGSQRLARSHTGSMTSALDVVDAACRASGAIRVTTPAELIDLAQMLITSGLPRGRRVAIISDSGGQGGIAADVAAASRLTTPHFSPVLQESLGRLLPAGASVSNPIDLAGAGEADLAVYARVAEILADSGEVDSVVLSGYLGCYGEDSPSLLDAELAAVDGLGAQGDRTGVSLIVHSMSATSAAVVRMREHRLPAYHTVEAGLVALTRAADLSESPGRTLDVLGESTTAPDPGYWAARGFLRSHGIAMPRAVMVRDPDQAAVACAELTGPFVLKAGWLEHKSEHGGVVVGLTPHTLPRAFADMSLRLGPGEYVVEEQDVRSDVVEMLVGARVDRDFGPTITVGYGGVEAELWRDVRTELAPVDRPTALSMIGALTCTPLLEGWRGRRPANIDALADLLVAVSRAICDHPAIDDLELNPVRLGPDAAVAVDALIVTRQI